MKILYTAALSVIVTLLIEWFARPWFETRKERALEQHRAMRDIIRMARKHVWDYEQYFVYKNYDSKPSFDPLELYQARLLVPNLTNKVNRQAFEEVIRLLNGVSRYTPADGEYYLLGACADVLDTPIWKIWKRRECIKLMHEEIQLCERSL